MLSGDDADLFGWSVLTIDEDDAGGLALGDFETAAEWLAASSSVLDELMI